LARRCPTGKIALVRSLTLAVAAVAVVATAVPVVPVVALVPATANQPAAAVASNALHVGAITLHRCDLATTHPAWCGHLRVPLDYTDPGAARIGVGFGWLPATGRPVGTLVAEEGGPGYPSTGTAADFETLFGPVLRHHNLLLVDARGTGRSTPIDCRPLQELPSPSPRFVAAVRSCGRQLNHTWQKADGSWVHASDLFTTANTARDLARVLDGLQINKVELYGDSYGTYFAQSFLARYPQRLNAVVLDSAYEARDLDAWYRTTVTTARAAFDTVCRRAAGCPTGSSWARISRLAVRLRHHPVTGRAVGTDGAWHRVTVGITALVNIVNDAGYDTDPYRQLDAAARALLQHDDATPLLRLYLQDVGYDYSDYSAAADYYSDGLYLAVACSDYPQLFDMRAAPQTRRRQLAASVGKLPPDTFAPFTTREWLSVLPYTETYTGCLQWPTPTHAADPPVPSGVALDATGVPVLILNGQLDSLTPAAGGAHIRRQIGPAAQAYVAANTVHLVGLENSNPCGSQVVRRFLRTPRRHLDRSCLRHIPAIHAVPNYPRRLSSITPARGSAPLRLRRLAAVAAAEAGDVEYRYNYVDANADRGLRGGRVHYAHDGTVATLTRVRFTADTSISGTVRVRGTGVSARLTVNGVVIAVHWSRRGPAHLRSGRYRLAAPTP
jgi:pimeloyl-ACP methyl ester carboxylesterase